MDAHKRTAVVTGAGSGIGRAVALGLAEDGYSLALMGRRPGPLEETAARIGAAAMAIPLDVGDAAAVQAGFAAAAARFGRLDLLFNNAGTGAPGLPDELSPERFDAVVRTNLCGAFYCAREAFARMRAQTPRGGRIINNGSISAHAPRPGSIAYTATKHAVTGLTRSLALDGRAFDIACGQIDIGNADTPMTAPMRGGVPQADGSVRPEPVMDLDAVVRSVRLMAGLPLDANVLFLTVAATKMPFIGRG